MRFEVIGGPLLAVLAAWLAAPLPATAEQERAVELQSMTCRQFATLAPSEVQATILGAIVGYAMGQADAPLDIDTVELWYAGLSALCNEAPDAKLGEVIPLIGDRAAAMAPQD